MTCNAAQLRRVVEILNAHRGERLSAAVVALALQLARIEVAQ